MEKETQETFIKRLMAHNDAAFEKMFNESPLKYHGEIMKLAMHGAFKAGVVEGAETVLKELNASQNV